MEFTAHTLVSRAAQELVPRADGLIQDVVRHLRREVPELWEDPEIARMTAQSVADHVIGGLRGLENGVGPDEIELPPADIDRAIRLTRLGKPVSTLLRALRLGNFLLVDRVIEEMPRLTADAGLVAAAARRLIALGTEYVDLSSERGVLLYKEEADRRAQWRLSTVNEAGRRIGTTLDIVRTTQELAELATEQFADRATVDLLEAALRGEDAPAEGTPVLRRTARSPAADGTPGATVPAEEPHTHPPGSPPDLALSTGQPSRHRADPSGRAEGAHSWLVVPLRARGTTLGVAQFFRDRGPDLFDDEDLLLAQEIAARAALAVDNARRYTHARATALALQRSLLPRSTPEHSAVEIACRYLPAGAGVGVGGDWYDVIPLSGARVALVVGDVVGHGVQAAATMGRLRTAVRTLADIDLPPDELLTRLDDVVLRLSTDLPGDDPDTDADGGVGATCLYAVYDPVSGRCTLARAGHVLPTLANRDGAVHVLDLPPGPPLGLGGLPFETAEIDLPEGSLLALYTDGLVESRDQDVEKGLARLHEALARPADSLEAVCDTVVRALLPDRPDDDAALLLARPRPMDALQVATWDLEAAPEAVSRVRADVSRQLRTWGLEELDFTAELVVSELVTNAIRYGRPPIRLRLIHDRTLLCEVSDDSNTTPHLRRARVFDEGGRGLLLVAQLADHWGTRHARHGKTVWAELTLTGGLSALTFD
ncbi:SpoIIE family protein phosphatase [Streptomyces sp. NPDC058739]|uniref:ATP-binding SpoIIE family protein phosphatase n=1 Tax=Streptomyces sp. NPDC058739 TaxID=3346618 RepID=UPI0036B0F719